MMAMELNLCFRVELGTTKYEYVVIMKEPGMVYRGLG